LVDFRQILADGRKHPKSMNPAATQLRGFGVRYNPGKLLNGTPQGFVPHELQQNLPHTQCPVGAVPVELIMIGFTLSRCMQIAFMRWLTARYTGRSSWDQCFSSLPKLTMPSVGMEATERLGWVTS
jgi:hypothetical protein